MLRTLAVDNYRSIRSLRLELDELNLVTGANGVGKSSLYRSLRLLGACARGGVVAALATEGGLASTLWAGPEKISDAMRRGDVPVQGTRRAEAIGLRLGFCTDDFGYAIDLGYPAPTGGPTAFGLDPEIKTETIWKAPTLRPAALLSERKGGAVRLRESDGSWRRLDHPLDHGDSMLAQIADPVAAPEVLSVREQIRRWRFYDHVRTDADAPARQSRLGTRTPVMSADGSDLAAALQTIIEVGDATALFEAVDRAFPGSQVGVDVLDGGRFEVRLKQPGMLRALGTAELSDGTLRFLLWAAALLTPRAPELMVLNEPETSLHPDLLPALGELIVGASTRSQVIVVTHSAALSRASIKAGARSIELIKDTGETMIAGQGKFEGPPWTWPKR
jgi:predicted ATPase